MSRFATLPKRQLATTFLVVAILLGLAPPGFGVSLPGDDPTPRFVTAQPEAYAVNLYENGNLVSQYTPYWCIGASMQMMLNIVGASDDRSRDAQERNMRVARSNGPTLRELDHGQNAGGLRGGPARAAGLGD